MQTGYKIHTIELYPIRWINKFPSRVYKLTSEFVAGATLRHFLRSQDRLIEKLSLLGKVSMSRFKCLRHPEYPELTPSITEEEVEGVSKGAGISIRWSYAWRIPFQPANKFAA